MTTLLSTTVSLRQFTEYLYRILVKLLSLALLVDEDLRPN